MNYEQATRGRGVGVSMVEAVREIRRHCLLAEDRGGKLFASADDGESWDRLRLNSKAILDWLGY